MDLNNKAELKHYIELGIQCFQQFGFSFRGAEPRPITKEKALELLPYYSPGKGFYELEQRMIDGRVFLVFTEYSESDMY